MNDILQMRLFCASIMALGVLCFTNRRDPKPAKALNHGTPQYTDFQYILWFPLYLALFYFSVCSEYDTNFEASRQHMFSVCFMIFLHLTIYYGALLTVLPALRSRFQARTCATLWLLPCLLYIFFGPGASSDIWLAYEQYLTIPLSSELASTLSKIWMLGFWMILIWKIASHILFGQRIEASARKITDPEILQIWEQEQKATGEYPLLSSPILQSPLIHTPLSIGVYKMNTILVLPEKEYTLEELELIFRHEIIHIQRRDGATKFFLVFCCALCWFNPLMWLGIRRSAEDMELSCDEAVLNSFPEKTQRHQYAKLLLQTAGEERGFTSCLAASTSALRYRLENIITPRSRKSGAVFSALVTFFMMMTIGCVRLSIV